MILLSIVNFIKKYWFIFLLIIVYLVIAGLNILPRSLNLFKKKQLMIDQTPLVVQEIKDIGEFVTAEFYGEVYADLNEVYEDIIQNYSDSLNNNPYFFTEQYPGLEKYKEISNAFQSEESKYKSSTEKYQQLNNVFNKKISENNLEKDSLQQSLYANINANEKIKIENRISALKTALKREEDSQRKNIENYSNIKNSYQEKHAEYRNKLKDRNLVYIGRGWVKAGIDLKKINRKEIFIDDADSLYLHLILNYPKILDADINPWFIYTKKNKVKGYELFIAKTGSMFASHNFTDQEIEAVKHKCKEKLIQKATQKGILERAANTSQVNLTKFFSLIGFEKIKISFKNKNQGIIATSN